MAKVTVVEVLVPGIQGPPGPPGSTIVTPEGYNAVGDGVADDSDAWEAAMVAAAATPGTRILGTPGAVYRIASGATALLDENSSPLIIDLNGSTLLIDESGFSMGGPFNKTPYLTTSFTVDPVKGATNLTLASVDGLVQGDMIEVLSPALSQGTITVIHIYVVQEVDPATKQVWIDGTVVADINPGQVAADGQTGAISVRVYHVAPSVQLMNGTVRAIDANGDGTAIQIRYVSNVLVDNIDFYGHTRNQLSLQWNNYCNVRDCYFKDFGYLEKDQGYVNAPSAPDSLGFGYGISSSRVYRMTVSNCWGGRGWHMHDSARGVMHTIIENCFLMRNSFGISCHECAWYFTVRDCIFDGGSGVVGARCAYLTVEGCVFRHLLEQAITYAGQLEVHIRDCLFDEVTTGGTQSTVYNASPGLVPSNGTTSAGWEKVFELRDTIHLGPLRVDAGLRGGGRCSVINNILDQGAVFNTLESQAKTLVQGNYFGNCGGNIASFFQFFGSDVVDIRDNTHNGGFTAGVTSWLHITSTATAIINFYNNVCNAEYMVRFAATDIPILNFIGNVNRAVGGRTFLNSATTNIITNFFDNKWNGSTFLSGTITITNEANNVCTGQVASTDSTSNADHTLTPFQNAKDRRYTATLTATRTITLSTTNAVIGQKWKITRTGSGVGFTWKIMGATLLASLKQYDWVEVTYISVAAGWVLTAFGNLFDFAEITPQMFGAVGDGVTDDSAAFNAVFTAFAASETSPAGMTSYGNGHLHIPKGKYLINSPLTLTSGKGLGLLITGDGIWTTTLLTTNLTGNLFTIAQHYGITIRDLAIIHDVAKAANPDPAWTNKCFAISNSGGGRKFALENVYISGFDRQISNDDTTNGDNLSVRNCIFTEFNTHYWNDSTQTVNTTYSDVLFTDTVGANKCFDVVGGPLSLRDIDCTIQGNFLNLRDTPAKYGNASHYILDNIALEWRSSDTSAGRPGKFIVVDGDDCVGDIYVIGCKLNGGSTPHANSLWMKVGGPMRIFVKGGAFDRKFELVGHTANTYVKQSYIEFDGTILDATGFVTLTAGGAGSSYPQVVLKNCPGIAELTLAYDNSHVVQPRKVAVITDLASSYMLLTTATFNYSFFNMPCRIRKIELHITKRTGIGAKSCAVYSDAARTVLIGTATITTGTLTAHEFYDFAVAANLVVTEGLFFTLSNADANILLGNIIIEYDCIGNRIV